MSETNADTNAVDLKSSREARARQQQIDGRKAWSEYTAEVEARDANTARLRALRLEREQAAANEAAAAPATTRRRAKKAAV